MCGSWPGTLYSDMTVASSKYDILLCSETLVLDIRQVSELLVPGYRSPCLVVPEQDASGPRDGCSTYEMVTEHFANPNLSEICFLGFVV